MNKKDYKKYSSLIIDYAKNHYKDLFREPNANLKYKFIVPGSGYSNSLWDWDSWFIDQALQSFVEDDITEYEKGCVLNFLDHTDELGRMPIFITEKVSRPDFAVNPISNIHKPILAQHALLISNKTNDFSWLSDKFEVFERYLNYYEKNCKHESGLFFWIDDYAIGVDNDPCTFFRPAKSSASILLNCFMYKEYLAMKEISVKLGLSGKISFYDNKAGNLKESVIKNCWDDKDGFFYNVDINLLPIDPNQVLHKGAPRHYNCLIQRIGVWSGFLAMWAGIASAEQAEKMIRNNYLDDKIFNSPYGVRSLSKSEKMYAILPSNNPSCWLGPVWGLTNYIVFDGLRKYGYSKLAKELALKTVELFGKDIDETGEMHEFYNPETGKTVYDKGFQSWNLFAVEMIKWLDKSK